MGFWSKGNEREYANKLNKSLSLRVESCNLSIFMPKNVLLSGILWVVAIQFGIAQGLETELVFFGLRRRGGVFGLQPS